MHIPYKVIAFCFLVSSLYAQSPALRGVDLSFLKNIENSGGVFKDNGTPTDAIQIFANHGVNCIRLRLWNNPANGYSGIQDVVLLAKRAKQHGMKVLLDFHYSDTWADPAHQTKPNQWTALTYTALAESLYAFTKSSLITMKQNAVLPEYVQIGNEITGGMLWNDGRVGGAYDSPLQWQQFTGLLKKGIQAVQDVNVTGADIKTIIHTDRGGDSATCKWFFDKLSQYGVLYDIIGLSYYPWWHNSLTHLSANMQMLANRYQKNILIVETAYPFTLGWNDNTNNVVGLSSQLHPGYSASPDGQLSFLQSIREIVTQVPNNKGMGFFYWEPDWIATPTFGSSWENLALFNFSGEALAGMQVFTPANAIDPQITKIKSYEVLRSYPNPFNPTTTIEIVVQAKSNVTLTICNLLGEQVTQLLRGEMSEGRYTYTWNATNVPSGIYMCLFTVNGIQHVKKIVLQK